MPTIIGSGVTGFNGGASSLSTALNISATGSDRCLVVATFVYGTGVQAEQDVSGVTYNGVAMTAAVASYGVWADRGLLRFWELRNPGTGSSFNIVATCGASVSELGILAAAFSDVDQTTPFGTQVGTNGTASTTSTGTVSLSGSDIALAAWTGYDAAGAYTITPNGTGIVEDENGNTGTTMGFQYRANATIGWTHSVSVDAFQQLSIPLKHVGGGGAATLTSATPSGTLGTQTTATLGATTDVTSGTFYGVVDTAGNISGITAAQVKAGQNNGSVSAVAASNTAVSTTSPATAVTGLTAATGYSYAVVQNSTGGDSNVLTGTFTTAAATVNPATRNFGPKGFLSTLVTM